LRAKVANKVETTKRFGKILSYNQQFGAADAESCINIWWFAGKVVILQPKMNKYSQHEG
jgi:hypothetical protein